MKRKVKRLISLCIWDQLWTYPLKEARTSEKVSNGSVHCAEYAKHLEKHRSMHQTEGFRCYMPLPLL